MESPQIFLIYDRQCPVCEAYCRMLRIRETVGELQLIDARNPGPLLDEVTAAGLDVDQGMVLKMDQELYYGSDAIHVLALISSPSGLFNRLNAWLFRSRYHSHLLYPVLRALRNLLLKFLGREKINNLNRPDNQWF